ncbi:MAG: TonB-dependent receptor [Paludibacter sp.]|nr:TonB-dependent receptor [Paludibacter sp.]
MNKTLLKLLRQVNFHAKIIFLINFIIMPLYAQDNFIAGVVTDELGNTIPGVSVAVQGKQNGTVTDVQGRYSIKVNKNDVLVFSFIGYTTQKVHVTVLKTTNVQLVPGTVNLDEVVVVGYGVQKKSHFSGALTGINVENENIGDIPVESIDKALQGRLSGVQILDTEGQVGVSPEIRIRGVASFNASNEPLIVIDGLPTTGNLSDVSANDIANMEVLKDAASTAIYGSRGANGVILITTKSGSNQKASFNVKVNMGMSKIVRYFDTYEIEDYARYYWNRDIVAPYETAYLKEGLPVAPGINEDGTYNSYGGKAYLPFEKFFSTEINPKTSNIYNKYGAGYAQLDRLNKLTNAPNPQESVIQDANSYNLFLSTGGGNQGYKYYLSLDYKNQDGIMINNSMQQMSLSANLSAQVTRKVRVELSLRPQFSNKEMSANTQLGGALRWITHPLVHDERTLMMTKKFTGESGFVYDWAQVGDYTKSRDFRRMWLMNDDYSDYVLNANGQRITVETYSGTSATTSYSDAMDSQDITRNLKLNGNLSLNWDVIKGLVFKSSIGGYVSVLQNDIWTGSLRNSIGVAKTGYGMATYSQSSYVNMVNENTLAYNKKIGNHQIDLLGGLSIENSIFRSLQAQGRYFESDAVKSLNYAGEIVSTGVDNDITEVALVSFFGRLNYNYKDKYILSALMRSDGSSQFGADNRWGTFPSLSAAWRITEEPFMRSFSNTINDLKLRASYGLSGNNRITSYAYVSGVDKVNYMFGNTQVNGYAISGSIMGNSLIGWEQTAATNIGISASFLRNRININIDGYLNKTKSLLLQNPLVLISGYSREWDNIGQIEGKGLELELNTMNIKTKKFLWTTSLNFTRSRSILVDYGGTEEQVFTGYKESLYRLKVGSPVGEYYGYKTSGEIWKTDAEISEAIAEGKAFMNTVKGSLKFEDTNGDGVLTDADRTTLGSPYPDFDWGMTNKFRYKGFDLSFTFQGSQGAEVWNICNVLGSNFLRWMNEDRYIDEYHGNKPDPTSAEFTNSDYLIEDASYIALRELSFGYTVPRTKFRIYFSGRNLLYLMADGYRGINPEYMAKPVSGMNLITGEQRYNATPAMRTFSLGIDYKF